MCITLSRTNHGAEDVLKVEVLSHQISWGGGGGGCGWPNCLNVCLRCGCLTYFHDNPLATYQNLSVTRTFYILFYFLFYFVLFVCLFSFLNAFVHFFSFSLHVGI